MGGVVYVSHGPRICVEPEADEGAFPPQEKSQGPPQERGSSKMGTSLILAKEKKVNIVILF